MSYSLDVKIDLDQYRVLKESGYNLCIAKKVNDVYNVVWSGASFLQFNTFCWVEKFQVFAQATRKQGDIIKSETEDEDIQYGQTCLLDKDGVMNTATGTVDQSGTFYVDNEFGSIHIGVCESFGDTGKMLPIFLSPTVVTGIESLTPVVSILVWFDLKLSTSSIFLDSVSNTAELVYEGSLTSQTATYEKNGHWAIGSQIQPKRGYLSTAGFYYESQAPINPYSLIEAARNDIPPQIKFSAATWMYELTAVFPSASDAINSWAYLRQKVIPNIKQDVDMVNDTTIKIRFGYDSVTYMKWMMTGETDAAKVKNAIILELNSLAVPPTSCSDFVMGNLAVMDSGHCHLYVMGTDIGLTCDTNDVVVYGNDDVS